MSSCHGGDSAGREDDQRRSSGVVERPAGDRVADGLGGRSLCNRLSVAAGVLVIEPQRRGTRPLMGLHARVFAAGLLAVLVMLVGLGVSAAACEGGGGPPGSPTGGELAGQCNPALAFEKDCVGDPVDVASGELTEAQTDVSVAGRGPGLDVTRTYGSESAAAASKPGLWGYGWTGPYDASLEVSGTTVTVHQDTGNAAVFYEVEEKYTQGGWDLAQLEKSGSSYVYTLPDQSKLEFNSEGQLVKETDRDGNSNTFTYNTEKQLETVTGPAGRTLKFAYDAGGQVESVTDPMGHVIKYTYTSGNLTSVTIEGKVRWEFAYESPHLLTKLTDGRGHVTTMEYEATTHRVVKQTMAGHERKFSYGEGETTIVEPNGSETVETFNAANEPTKITQAKGTSIETTTEYEYSGTTFEPTKMTDGNGHITKYGYDSEGNRTSETDATSDETKWEYDSKHNLIKETTPEAEATTIKRNTDGEPIEISRAIGTETQKSTYKYDEQGDLTEETNPLEGTTKYTYTEAGLRESETNADGDKTTWEYDEDGQVTAEVSPRGNVEGAEPSKFTTKTEYDERGLPTKTTDPLGHTAEYEYDGNGNVTAVTDGNAHTTKYTYNEENLLTAEELPNATIVKTGYDAEGQMTSHTDGNEHTWEYKRNKLEQITEEIDPLAKKTVKSYDKAGNLEKVEDPEAHAITYTYDASNRPTEVKYSTGKPGTVKYEYNKDGMVTTMTDETGTTENTWDKLDRLTAYKDGAGKTVKYEYNLGNEPTKITYPNSEAVTRAYDKAGRLTAVTDWNGKETKFAYNPDGRLTKTTFPSGTENEDVYAYNSADQMSEIEMLKGTETLASLKYGRDGDGQVTNTVSKGLPGEETLASSYDENNRLTKHGTSSYAYDAGNNPTEVRSETGYSYNNADELEKGPTATYSYNSDGQRTETKPTSGPATSYTYDQNGNLTSVKRPEEGEIKKIEDEYTYNGNNLRQSQTINGTTTQLTWGTAEALPLLLSDETNSYIYGPENAPVEQIPATGETQYLHHDQQGSTRLLTGASGATSGAYSYAAYGAVSEHTGTATTPLEYDGQYESADTGLIYLRARTYDPATAQFLSLDPLGLVTGMPYGFAADGPLTYQDSTGQLGYLGGIGLGAALGGAAGAAGGLGSYLIEKLIKKEELTLRGAGAALAGGATGGAVIGGCMVATLGKASAMCGALGGAAGGAMKRLIEKKKTTVRNVAEDAAMGAICGRVGGIVGKRLVKEGGGMRKVVGGESVGVAVEIVKSGGAALVERFLGLLVVIGLAEQQNAAGFVAV